MEQALSVASIFLQSSELLKAKSLIEKGDLEGLVGMIEKFTTLESSTEKSDVPTEVEPSTETEGPVGMTVPFGYKSVMTSTGPSFVRDPEQEDLKTIYESFNQHAALIGQSFVLKKVSTETLYNALIPLNLEFSITVKPERNLTVATFGNTKMYPSKINSSCPVIRMVMLRGSVAAVRKAQQIISTLDA